MKLRKDRDWGGPIVMAAMLIIATIFAMLDPSCHPRPGPDGRIYPTR